MAPDKINDLEAPSGSLHHHQNDESFHSSGSNLIVVMSSDHDASDDDGIKHRRRSRKKINRNFPMLEIETTSQRDFEVDADDCRNAAMNGTSALQRLSYVSSNTILCHLYERENYGRSDSDIDNTHTKDTPSIASIRRGQYRSLSVNLCLVILVGITACVIILTVGLMSVRNSKQASFQRTVDNVVSSYKMILDNYVTLGLWTHEACSEARQSNNPRASFRHFWEYVQQGDSFVHYVSCAINVTHDERVAYENETRTFLAESNLTFNGVDASLSYFGFKEVKKDEKTQAVSFGPRSQEPFYLPAHFVEPVEDPYVLFHLDVDIYSIQDIQQTLNDAVQTSSPLASRGRSSLSHFQEENDNRYFGVSLAHPGIVRDGVTTDIIANIPISCNHILARVHEDFLHLNDLQVVVYDTSGGKIADPWHNFFICGAILHQDNIVRDLGTSIEFIHEVPFEDSLQHDRGTFLQTETFEFASREWTLVISSTGGGGQEAQLAFIALGAVLILVATISLTMLIYTNAKKIRSINMMKSSIEAEKTQIRLENARKAAQQERDLNDFIAHEVRNPLNAALAANTFVSACVNEAEPLITEEKRASVREDVQIIDNSLHFINDLLRNMLDMQRAASNQLNIELTLVDVKSDILEPVASMLYRRGVNFEVIVECPTDRIIVESDSLRLKQVVLNLGRNAAKFVEKGFVRLRSEVIDNDVHILIEDSGPGVPADKQDNLFGRFQESLDSLNQGTGIGLALCKNLTELLGGSIWLNKEYNSGVEGCPGACFVINLRCPPIKDDGEEVDEAVSTQESKHFDADESQTSETSRTDPLPALTDESNSDRTDSSPPPLKEEDQVLPPGLSVLFVDDDFTLRKLFVRAVTRVTNGWNIDQASNGETAVVKVQEQHYDIIFVDQYMASTTKQLLGTETTREMRAKGCQSVIFGLSANDLESQFFEAGSDGFIMKPFPCKPEPLRQELLRVVELVQRKKKQLSGTYPALECAPYQSQRQ
ncbi:multi-sensor hybrid histidine kinase [Nitzschia inconspicua]|uniref:histidine kinase n=1 Tax=Nitzschia inconspicua TaxID=303405 RepID=A0A9K3KL33_9STRA|nr:multi-sensor hybrid histidine kinase [Nitzschia inconspicua]